MCVSCVYICVMCLCTCISMSVWKLYMHLYLCMYACAYECVSVCMFIDIYVCLYICSHLYSCISIHACIYICIWLCMYVCLCAGGSVHIFVGLCMMLFATAMLMMLILLPRAFNRKCCFPRPMICCPPYKESASISTSSQVYPLPNPQINCCQL